MVHGELQNIKSDLIEKMDSFYDYVVPAGQLITVELAEKMLAVTEVLGREVAVYLNRQGKFQWETMQLLTFLKFVSVHLIIVFRVFVVFIRIQAQIQGLVRLIYLHSGVCVLMLWRLLVLKMARFMAVWLFFQVN